MYLEYPSTQDPALKLFAAFEPAREPRPMMVYMHGWHGQIKKSHSDNVNEQAEQGWFSIRPEMRGRGDSTGRPDCNGWELQDVVDAVEFARRTFVGRILHPELVYLRGGSGGGGNVFAQVGKFPDYFCRAHSSCGISDYEQWYREDTMGEFRDEMNPWIGCSPDENAEAYASRSGLATVQNLMIPLQVVHGETDIRVPSAHSRRFVQKAAALGKGNLVEYHELKGVGTRNHWGGITPEQEKFIDDVSREFMARPTREAFIPCRGSLAIAGYLKTRSFEVILDSIDRVGMVSYDLDASRFDIAAPTAKTALLRVRTSEGEWAACRVDTRR